MSFMDISYDDLESYDSVRLYEKPYASRHCVNEKSSSLFMLQRRSSYLHTKHI